MKQKSGMIGVVYAAILSAIAGYFFRMTQLSGGSSVPLLAFSILMVFVFALAAVSLEKKSAYEAVYRPSGQDLTFSLLGALGLIAGCVLSFRGSIAQMLVSLLGLLAGLSLGAGAVLRWKEKKPSAAFSVFVVLFYVAKLFRDFRHWEINPAILDYCFSLFAMIAFMLASYHAGAFSFERGARRRLAFYSLLGVLFGAISLAGAQLPELLIYAGSVFWMLACAQQMPIFAALGAQCTVLDYSQRQLDSEKLVAEREGYDITIVRADMTKRLPFDENSFDLIFHPVSNCYVYAVLPIWRECARVLKPGGRLLAGLDNGLNFAFDEDETRIINTLPFNPLEDEEQMRQLEKDKSGVQFSHTAHEQLTGQLKAGLQLLDLYEDTNGYGNLHAHNIPTYWATLARKA